MNKDYAVSISKLHGDFNCCEPTASVLRIKNLHVSDYPKVLTSVDTEGFEAETGFEHSTEAYIRSCLILYDTLNYTVEEVNWRTENDICKQAVVENQMIADMDMTFCYDDVYEKPMFEYSSTHHYEFDLPDEMLLVIPVDLCDSQYEILEGAIWNEFLSHLAWRQLWTLIPVSNIREVPNVI